MPAQLINRIADLERIGSLTLLPCVQVFTIILYVPSMSLKKSVTGLRFSLLLIYATYDPYTSSTQSLIDVYATYDLYNR